MCKMTKYKRGKIRKISDVYSTFFEALTQNSLEELVKTAEMVFGLPVVLHDENSRLLYQYPKRLLNDKIWDSYFEQQTINTTMMHEYQHKFLHGRPVDFEPFYFQSEDPEEGNYLFGQIYHQQKTYGYITVFLFDNPPDESDIERMRIFAKAVGIIMCQRNRTRSVSLNAMLYDALTPDVSKYKQAQALSFLEKRLHGKYIMMVKPIGPNTNQKTFATMCVRQMPIFREDIVLTIYENCIVILYGNIRKTNYMESEKKIFNPKCA